MKNIIIIGNSAAGISALESIRNKDKDSRIIIISDEDYSAYSRYKLFDYLSGEIKEEQLIYRAKEFYTQNNIDLMLGKKVIKVEPSKNRVILEDNQKLEYTSLLIATGASPNLTDIKGAHKHGVFGIRTLGDIQDMLSLLPITNTACILSDGVMGLKLACILKKRGIEVKVITKSKQILSLVLDDEPAAGIIQRHLESQGIELLTGLDISEILGNGDIKAIRLSSGKVIGCQLLIIDKGILPNTKIVRDTEVKVNRGILVDRSLAASVENIFAAGDCAEISDTVTAAFGMNTFWQNAVMQGETAGRNILGENLIYEDSVVLSSTEIFGLPMVFAGILKETEGMDSLSHFDYDNKIYKKILFKDNCLKGVVLIGRIDDSERYLKLIKENTDITSIKNNLIEGVNIK